MDLEKIRGDFPFKDIEVDGQKIVYFDNAATVQHPQSVIDAQVDYMKYKTGNPHRGVHYLGNQATAVYENGREKVKDFIGAKRSEEIVFTRSTTESLNLLAYSWAMEYLKEGDEILISIAEHHSNIVPWQFVCKKKGCKLVYFYLNDDYTFDMEDFKNKLNSKTKLVSITGASNVLGVSPPIKEIIDLSHEVGAKVIVDAAQMAPHMKIDVKDLDCDFLAFSGHKMFSSMGIGVLYGKYDLLDETPPYNFGGDMIEYVEEQSTTFAPVPTKFEAGTQNVDGVNSLVAAIDYLNSIGGPEEVGKYEEGLARYCYDKLVKLPHVKVYHPDLEEAGVSVAFNIDEVHPHDAGTIFDSFGIAIRAGHHCTQPLHKYLGINSSCRASFSVYNTKEEIDYFIDKFKDVRRIMRLGD